MEPTPQHRFATTQWSLVLEAGRRTNPDADAALESLCGVYWFPLYAFARRRGCSPDDAADLTQEFFSRLIEKSFLETADPERGRFRTFLLTIFQRFLAKEYDRSQAAKRGASQTRLSIDFNDGEMRYAGGLTDEQTPERIFERHWALTLLQRVVDQLRTEYQTRDKAVLFEQCRSFLVGSQLVGEYAQVAQTLKMTEGALRVAVHRLRERYRELLRNEIAGTIADEASIDDELNYLRQAIRGENG
ncbi:MAG: sigma-70 family RNA polymerase sigma factor [Planctomycetota bacterium]|nr:sigma-70 family RNA polymerase sigma factor [Planctomycetota bacterium]